MFLYQFFRVVLNHIYTEGRENNECRSGRIPENPPRVLLNFYSRIIDEFLPKPKITHLSKYDIYRRTYMPYFNIFQLITGKRNISS